MKKALLAITAFVSLSAFTVANLPIWNVDKAHAELGFSVNHLGISEVSGGINDFEATVSSKNKDFSDAVFTLKANVASIDTRVEARDNHLKSADFFDVEKYPTLTFKSTKIKKRGKNKYKLTGDMTIKDVTKSVTLDLTYNGTLDDAKNNKQTAGFKITGTINRSDFGLGSGFAPPMISNEVELEANGEFVIQY